jgi:P27 family predicted phage terminase small subunit
MSDVLAKLPLPPKHLCRVAAAEWRRAGDFLIGRRLLTLGDLGVLEAYVRLYARLRRLEDAIAGAPLLGAAGKPSPLIGAANQTSAALSKQASLLGVAPITRSRLRKDAQPPADDDDPSDWASILPRGGQRARVS